MDGSTEAEGAAVVLSLDAYRRLRAARLRRERIATALAAAGVVAVIAVLARPVDARSPAPEAPPAAAPASAPAPRPAALPSILLD